MHHELAVLKSPLNTGVTSQQIDSIAIMIASILPAPAAPINFAKRMPVFLLHWLLTHKSLRHSLVMCVFIHLVPSPLPSLYRLARSSSPFVCFVFLHNSRGASTRFHHNDNALQM
jgi:hypothetical protein